MSGQNSSPFGRWAALQDETYWVPLKGIVRLVADKFDLDPPVAGDLIASGFVDCSISAIDPATGNVPSLIRAVWEDMIDWRLGELRLPGLPSIPLMVHWPDVERAALGLRLGATIDAEPTPAVLPAGQEKSSVVRKGRPPKYKWVELDAALAAKLCDDGYPEKQADLEQWAMSWFPPDNQPAESQVRERVSKAIKARREADGILEAGK